MDDISSVPEVKEWVNELLNYLVDELKFEYKSRENGWDLWRDDFDAILKLELVESGMRVYGLFPAQIHESINLQILNVANAAFETFTFYYYPHENAKERICFRFLIPMFMEPEYVEVLILNFSREYSQGVSILRDGRDAGVIRWDPEEEPPIKKTKFL